MGFLTRTRHEWGAWENVTVFDSSGWAVLIQSSKCTITGKARIRRVKLGWVNDHQALNEIRKYYKV